MQRVLLPLVAGLHRLDVASHHVRQLADRGGDHVVYVSSFPAHEAEKVVEQAQGGIRYNIVLLRNLVPRYACVDGRDQHPYGVD